MKQDWTKRLRDRLADHEEPAPEDLWTDIEAALVKRKAVGKSTPARIVPLWGRWAVAATIAALIASGGYLMWEPERDISTGGNTTAKLDEKMDPVRGPVTVPLVEETAGHVDRPPLRCVQGPQQVLESPSLVEPLSQPESQSQPDTVLHFEPEHRQLPEPEENWRILDELDCKIATGRKRRPEKMAFSLYASNGFGDQQHRNGVLMSSSQLANYGYTHAMTRAEESPVWLYNYEERQKHHQPVSLGLTVKIPISSAFSLSSGVVYTRLRSDFSNILNGYSLEQKQTLHYIGIPLSGQYLLWRLRSLSVYAVVGGQVDFNVKAEYISSGTEIDFERDRTQWSVQGALGLEYDIIPQLGVYAEPGVKYYFDNGSHVRNFFKDKPTNFNLQLGLRLNL